MAVKKTVKKAVKVEVPDIKKMKHAKASKPTIQDLRLEVQDNHHEHIFDYIGNDVWTKETNHILFSTHAGIYRHELKPYVEKYGYEMVNKFAIQYAKNMSELRGKPHDYI